MRAAQPRLLVFTTVFPHAGQPHIGLFVRERMFRVAQRLPTSFVVPVPWFPGQGVLRRYRPGFRPPAPRRELQQGFQVEHPRYVSVPGIGKRWDGLLLALGALPTLRRLRRGPGFDVLDAHFGYPDGYAASLLGRWLGVPVTITLRGNETAKAGSLPLRQRIRGALGQATRVFTVSDSLRRFALGLGVDPQRVEVVPNGVDSGRFIPVDRSEARARLGVPPESRVLVTVGSLIERKGFHRVIDCLPALRREFPDLLYLIVGGTSPEENWRARLEQQVDRLGLRAHVRFLGVIMPDELRHPLSAADVFVLATSREGWANVLLEAMACGLPVVTTDVGGNAEVVCRPGLGTVVPFGDAAALEGALCEALRRDWDRSAILAYARENGWDARVDQLVRAFRVVAAGAGQGLDSRA